MANVLNEFLHSVSKGFQDAAFASFTRRRSTVRGDINQSFSSDMGSASSAATPAQDYLDLLNGDDGIDAMVDADSATGLVDAGSDKKPTASKPGKKGGAVDGDELKEI
jgi:hypothetical protein